MVLQTALFHSFLWLSNIPFFLFAFPVMIHLLIIAVYYSLEILTFFFIDNLILFAYLSLNWRKTALPHRVGFFHTTAGATVTACISPASGAGRPSLSALCIKTVH